jgi:hypothetical protein
MSNGPVREEDITRVSWTRWLLVIPFIVSLWVPFYNSVEPKVWGMPMYYWYQLLWVLIGAAIAAIVYSAERK